ncbi:MAG: hypothetical protein WC677_02510 [Clostridia bacterium]
MEVKDVVDLMLIPVKGRKEIFSIASERGKIEEEEKCDVLHIEKWLLTEMLAKLKEMALNECFDYEGEHQYPDPIETGRFEHCDLWWSYKEIENWLEVKTIIFKTESDYISRPRIKYLQIKKDLQKMKKINKNKYHLSFLFPIINKYKNDVSTDLKSFLKREFEDDVLFINEWQIKLSDDQYLLVQLNQIR